MPIVIQTQLGNVQADALPGRCPVCGNRIQPLDMGTAWTAADWTWTEKVLRCPSGECGHLFIARYKGTRAAGGVWVYSLAELFPVTTETTEHSEVIKAVSPDFAAIFKQAESADKSHLDLICGPGYRKALEFLIKDYVIRAHPDKVDEIKKLNLAKCIADHVSDGRVKQVAARAVWLGNDETHYLRKWEEKDLNDLKMLISLTLHWIEMDELTKKVMADMPEGR